MFEVIGGAAAGAAGAAAAAAVAIGAAVAGSAAPGQARFRVEPDQVFALANRFDQIANDIEAAADANGRPLVAHPPGRDKPSVDAADRLVQTAFGDAGLVTRTRKYAEELRAAARALRQTAAQYGLTDTTEGARFGAAAH
jgi:hypothetical protein